MSCFPLLLDGKQQNTGQGQEGNFDQRTLELEMEKSLIEWLRNKQYKWYAKYFNDTELLLLWDTEPMPYDKPRERIIRQEKHDQLMNRVLEHGDEIIAEQDALLQKMRSEKPKKHAGYELGAREFTLTYSPKWFSDDEARSVFTTAVNRLIKYYSDEIIELRAVGEVGSNGLSHVHCFYKLVGGLKISDKNFKRAYSYWNPKVKQGYSGHQGGHHATVKTESDFKGYIEKDIDFSWLEVNYPKK